MVLPTTQIPERTRAAEKDEEFAIRRRKTFREVAATFERTAPLDLGAAIDHTMMRWPEYSALYAMDPCDVFL